VHPNLSFWGQSDFFCGGAPPPHPTAPRPLLTEILNTPLCQVVRRTGVNLCRMLQGLGVWLDGWGVGILALITSLTDSDVKRTFQQGPGLGCQGPGQGLHSQGPGQGPGFEYKDQDKDKDRSKCGHISVNIPDI